MPTISFFFSFFSFSKIGTTWTRSGATISLSVLVFLLLFIFGNFFSDLRCINLLWIFLAFQGSGKKVLLEVNNIDTDTLSLLQKQPSFFLIKIMYNSLGVVTLNSTMWLYLLMTYIVEYNFYWKRLQESYSLVALPSLLYDKNKGSNSALPHLL